MWARRRLMVATAVAAGLHALAILAVLGLIGPVRALFRHPIGLMPVKGGVALAVVWGTGWWVFRRAVGPGKVDRSRAGLAALAGLVAYPLVSVARVFLASGVTTSLKFGLLLSVLPPLAVATVLALPRRPVVPGPTISPAERVATWRFRRAVGGTTLLGLLLNVAVIGLGRLWLSMDDLMQSTANHPESPWFRPAIVSISYVIGLALVLLVLGLLPRGVADRFERFWTSAVIAGLASIAALSFFPYAQHAGSAALMTWVIATLIGPTALAGLTFAIGDPPPRHRLEATNR